MDKDAQFTPFLYPTPRQLHPVPLEFQNVAHFAMLIGNNLLAEFWHLIQEGPRGPAIKAMPASDGKLNLVNDFKLLGHRCVAAHRFVTQDADEAAEEANIRTKTTATLPLDHASKLKILKFPN